jgi:3-deoxy-D-manno-octulosonic-acid transferase
MTGVAGAFVKSQLQADRFANVGVRNIHITGELRFDQPIPETLLTAAAQMAPRLANRPVITFASAVEGEDAMFITVIKDLLRADPTTLVIYVPRAPERFDDVAQMLIDAGLPPARRSEVFTADLDRCAPDDTWIDDTQVILGDSLGEMYFYLSLADRVVVGAGFVPAGAHNIIEPLALGKPVVTGPYTFTIEYPFVEAQAAGVALSVADAPALIAALSGDLWTDQDQIATFMDAHSGASAKTLAAIKQQISGPV